MPYTSYYAQTYDPGVSAGAGALWADISQEPPVVQVRNRANTGWDAIAGIDPVPALPALTLGTANSAGSGGYVAANASVAIFDTTAPVTQNFGDVAATGAVAFAARRDHVHGMPANPAAFAINTFSYGTATAAGAAATAVRTDATLAIFDATAPVTQAFGDAATVGAAAFAARRDHKHGMPANPVTYATNTFAYSTATGAGVATTAVRSDATLAIFDTTAPVTQNYSDVAATGSAAFAARRDHVHGMPASGGASGGTPALTLGTTNTAGVAGTFIRDDDTILVFDATVPVTQAYNDVAATGAATTAARRDHKHGMPAKTTLAAPNMTLGTANADGAAASAVRTDSTIALFDTTAPVTQAFGDAAAVGVIAFAARRDHKHGMPANPAAGGTPALTLGTANSAGVATTFIREDDTILVFDATAPVTQAFSDVAAVGAATTAARRDHKHGMPANPASFAINTFSYSTATAAGAASTAVRTDATLAIFDATIPAVTTPAVLSVTGAAAVAARRDHGHQSPGGVAALLTTVAIANTETQVLQFSIPANFMQAGTSFKIRAFGTATTGGTPGTPTARARVGTTSLTGNVAASVAPTVVRASASNAPFVVEVDATVYTAGAGGTIIGRISIYGDVGDAIFSISGIGGEVVTGVPTATVAVDTTATKLIELTFISGAAGDTWTFRGCVIAVDKM
jgi:hypothetical protein